MLNRDNGVHIWDEWADENGDLGYVYGKQWRSWETTDGRVIDQISQVVDLIKNHPDSRRILVTAWNPAEIDKMALPPCHCLFQFYVADGMKIPIVVGIRKGPGDLITHMIMRRWTLPRNS